MIVSLMESQLINILPYLLIVFGSSFCWLNHHNYYHIFLWQSKRLTIAYLGVTYTIYCI
jgi:hypothetical protein